MLILFLQGIQSFNFSQFELQGRGIQFVVFMMALQQHKCLNNKNKGL